MPAIPPGTPILLDSGPLGRLAHRSPRREDSEWLAKMLAARVRLLISEVADYEVRRNLLLHRNLTSLARLDILKANLIYVPIATVHMLKAADLWADARLAGKPTADPKELDCDVILAAQAIDAGATIATTNVGHLSRYAVAVNWLNITPP